MSRTPAISVIIPTRGRPERLSRCLMCLSAQSIGTAALEVVVVHDGPRGRDCPDPAVSSPMNLRFIEAQRLGNAHAKNVGIEAARAPLVLFMNDDVLPAHDCLAAHLTAHSELTLHGRPAMVMGYSPFVTPRSPTLFDRLMNDTSAVFFYDRMIDTMGRAQRPADHDWGYRHAWTLNLSVSRAAVMQVGGFRAALANCCYEDVELGYRLARHAGMPVLFRPEAFAPHDHRFTPKAYLEREFRLGYSAHGFAAAAPACAAELFGREIASDAEMDYARAFIAREGRDAERLMGAFEAMAQMPAQPGTVDARLLEVAYAEHLPLKRLAFRRGLLSAATNQRVDGLFHISDGLEAEPGLRPVAIAA